MKQATNRPQSEAQILKELFNVKLHNPAKSKEPLLFMDILNRGVTPAHATELTVSLNDMGWIRPIVIFIINLPKNNLVGKYIGDGQHTYMAAMRLGLCVPYVEVKIDSMEQLVRRLAMLNSTSKAWGLGDFVKAWSSIHDDYKKLARYKEIYDLELSCIAGILHESHSIFSSFNIIKDGTLKIKNEEKAVMYLNYVSDFVSVLPKLERGFGRRIINAYHFYLLNNHDTYNHTRFLKNLKKKTDALSLNTDDYTKFFSSLA